MLQPSIGNPICEEFPGDVKCDLDLKIKVVLNSPTAAYLSDFKCIDHQQDAIFDDPNCYVIFDHGLNVDVKMGERLKKHFACN